MAEQDLMSPNASPNKANTPTGVRRVNNLPLLIGIGILLIFTLIIAKVASGRAEQTTGPKEEGAQGKGGNSSMMATSMLGDRTGGVIEAAAQPPLLPADGTMAPDGSTAPAAPGAIPIARVGNLDQPPQPPRGSAGSPQQPTDLMDEQLRQRKMDLFRTAVDSKTKIDLPDVSRLGGDRSNDTPRTRDEIQERIAQVRRQVSEQQSIDPGAAYQAQLRQVQATISGSGSGGSGRSGMSLASNTGKGQDYGAFDTNGKTDRWSLNATVEAPTTPYEVSAGDVIPGMMISGLKTARQGQIIAQVSKDVYDSQSGCYLLIPNGTRLVGTYSNDMGFGEETVLVAWQRMRFRDGSKLDIGAMPGTDMAGYSGFQDLVDKHLLRIYTSAFLMSAITAGASVATNNGSNNSGNYEQPSVNSEMTAALGQQIGQTSAQIIAKNLNVAPTATIRPGYRFNIMVVKDLKFDKPFQTYNRCSRKP